VAGTVRPAEKSLKMDTILPVAPAAMAHLDALALYPDAPIVAVHWMDAGFSSTEEIDGRDLPKGYRAGCPDCTVGLFVGVEDGCVILSESAYVRGNKPTRYRHIWNIPMPLVIRIDELRPASGHLEVA